MTPITHCDVGPDLISSDLWICCGGEEGSEVSIFTTNTMEEVCKHPVKENQIQCMKQCGQYVWVPSRTDIEYGVVNIFNKSTKDLIIRLELKENTISCITNSDQLVYLGTMEGNCFIFPTDASDIQSNTEHYCKCISEHCVDGLALSQSYLWVSIQSQIHFLNPHTLKFECMVKRTVNTGANIGRMMLSDSGDMIWSAHLGGVVLSAQC